MNLESVNTEWFDSDALRLPNYKVGRVSYGDYGRSYVRINEDGSIEKPFRLYTSLTTAINQCAPMEHGLLSWYCEKGMVEAKRLLKDSQHYGTLMHKMFGKWLIESKFDFGTIQDEVDEYCGEYHYYSPEVPGWARKLKFDIAAFIHFTKERNLKPLGIEYVLLSEKGFGTLIDLVCEMDISESGFFGDTYKSGDNKGQPKETKRRRRIRAIINFKSGRHAFYRTNGIQIECERQLWEENFPDLPLHAAFNWSPKEWDLNPGYNLRDWVGEITQQEIDAVLSLAEIRFGTKSVNKKYVDIYGTQWRDRDLSCVHVTDVETYCINKFSNELA
jgi:hypothetical protein